MKWWADILKNGLNNIWNDYKYCLLALMIPIIIFAIPTVIYMLAVMDIF